VRPGRAAELDAAGRLKKELSSMMNPHTILVRLLIGSCLLLGSTAALWAEDPYYPFAEGVRPKLFPVTPLQLLDNSYPEITLGLKGTHGKPEQVLIRINIEEVGTTAEIFDQSGRPIRGSVLVSTLHSPGHGYVADLNGDQKLDYVLDVWSGGNGIAAAICETAFFLSSPAGYSISISNSWAPERADFLDVLTNGRCLLLHRSFIRGDPIKGKDGRTHNYWVYNLLEVVGDRLELRNAAVPGFPKWILYTFRSSHGATDQLREDQKTQLWNS
jgi:hypothetical protein